MRVNPCGPAAIPISGKGNAPRPFGGSSGNAAEGSIWSSFVERATSTALPVVRYRVPSNPVLRGNPSAYRFQLSACSTLIAFQAAFAAERRALPASTAAILG